MLGGDFPSSVRYAYVVETVGERRGVASEGGGRDCVVACVFYKEEYMEK